MTLVQLVECSDSEDEVMVLEQCMATARRFAGSDSEDEPESAPESSDSEDELGPVARMLRARQASALSLPAPREEKLRVSETCWAAQQRLRRSTVVIDDDEEVSRAVKAILNKLTIERFGSLFEKLLSCGVKTSTHMQLLIDEIFEKATTQHLFIDMYADLCIKFNDYFSEHAKSGEGVDANAKIFRKILITACQTTFRRNLTPPEKLNELSERERIVVEAKYKTKMMGNLKLIGGLLVRKMLVSKILLSILNELLSMPTPEALESLAVLLTVTGSSFDTPKWAHHAALGDIFSQLEALAADGNTDTRSRCLLQDLLDLRAAGWQDRRPKKLEAPTTLAEVARKQAKDLAPSTSSWSTWESQWSPSWQWQTTRSQFDCESFRTEMGKTLAELRVSHDSQDATERLAEGCVPPEAQVAELCEWLTLVVQESSNATRKAGFEVATNLVLQGSWQPATMELSLQTFVQDIVPDLQCDVPGLSAILNTELYPLVQHGFQRAASRW